MDNEAPLQLPRAHFPQMDKIAMSKTARHHASKDGPQTDEVCRIPPEERPAFLQNSAEPATDSLSMRGDGSTGPLRSNRGLFSLETKNETDCRFLSNVDCVFVSDPPPRAFQHLWVRLCPKDTWNSIALVPCDDKVDIVAIGHGFARAAAMDRHCRVLLVLLEQGVGKSGNPQPKKAERHEALNRHSRPAGMYYEVLDLTGDHDRESIVYHQFLSLTSGKKPQQDHPHGHMILALGNLAERPKGALVTQGTDFNYLFFTAHESLHTQAASTAKLIGTNRIGGFISLDKTTSFE